MNVIIYQSGITGMEKMSKIVSNALKYQQEDKIVRCYVIRYINKISMIFVSGAKSLTDKHRRVRNNVWAGKDVSWQTEGPYDLGTQTFS